MIKGITPSLAEGGKIKTGGLGEERQGRNGPWRVPVKLDHFLITKTWRDPQGNFALDHDVMEALPKDADGKVREIPIVVHSDAIDEVFPTSYALYMGRKLACSGDGESAERWGIDNQGNRSAESQTVPCPCDELGKRCKPHGTLHCSIALPGQALAGAVHKWRTTSMISIERMIGALTQVKSITGALRGLPLVLRVQPVQVNPDGGKPATVYCCHIELRGKDVATVQKLALDLGEMRRAVGSGDYDRRAYRALIAAPGAADEDDEEQGDVAEEFHPEVIDAGTGEVLEDAKPASAPPAPAPTGNDAIKAAAAQAVPSPPVPVEAPAPAPQASDSPPPSDDGDPGFDPDASPAAGGQRSLI